jgi:hypothetical protein
MGMQNKKIYSGGSQIFEGSVISPNSTSKYMDGPELSLS